MYQLENFSEKDFLEAIQGNIKIFYMALKAKNNYFRALFLVCVLYPKTYFLSVFFAGKKD
jgi:hypothetical protein